MSPLPSLHPLPTLTRPFSLSLQDHLTGQTDEILSKPFGIGRSEDGPSMTATRLLLMAVCLSALRHPIHNRAFWVSGTPSVQPHFLCPVPIPSVPSVRAHSPAPPTSVSDTTTLPYLTRRCPTLTLRGMKWSACPSSSTIGHRMALRFRLTMLCPSVCSDWSRVPQSLDQTAPSMAMTAMKAPDGPHVHHQERSPQLPEPPAEGANEDQVRSGHRHSPAGQVRSSQQGQPQTHFQEHPSMTGRPTDT